MRKATLTEQTTCSAGVLLMSMTHQAPALSRRQEPASAASHSSSTANADPTLSGLGSGMIGILSLLPVDLPTVSASPVPPLSGEDGCRRPHTVPGGLVPFLGGADDGEKAST